MRTERRRRKVDPSRLAAWDVLHAVRADDAYANLVLPRMVSRHRLTGRDAAFATELVSGTLRWQAFYDAVIDACLTRPRLQADVRDVLRLGVHQVLAMRVPDHAAISTSVDLVVETVGRGPSGLVNAVLRKVTTRSREEWIDAVAPAADVDRTAHLALAWSHPRWVVEALDEALAAPDELEALLRADNEPPRVTLVARPGLATVAELVEAGAEPTAQSPVGAVLAGGDPSLIAAVAEGRAGVQDEGSQLVALALAEAEVIGPDRLWLDLCAGPGGKAALLAALAAERGALVVAHERQEHRAQLVREGLRAVAPAAWRTVVGDGVAPSWRPGTFDRVLVDAPCSGLGALRRRPESRWRRRPEDLDGLVPLQEALLSVALDSVRPGGVVVYATCSPVVRETRGVVDAVLIGRGDVVEEQAWQLWPHRDGTDAMFAATLRRLAP